MPRLRDLDASFVRFTRSIATWTRITAAGMARTGGIGPHRDDEREIITGLQDGFEFEPYFELAHGLFYLCPKCFAQNGGAVGTHRVLNWFANCGVPDDADPKPGRWIPAGTGLDDITFVGPQAASVLLTGEGGCRWHGYVKNGAAE